MSTPGIIRLLFLAFVMSAIGVQVARAVEPAKAASVSPPGEEAPNVDVVLDIKASGGCGFSITPPQGSRLRSANWWDVTVDQLRYTKKPSVKASLLPHRHYVFVEGEVRDKYTATFKIDALEVIDLLKNPVIKLDLAKNAYVPGDTGQLSIDVTLVQTGAKKTYTFSPVKFGEHTFNVVTGALDP